MSFSKESTLRGLTLRAKLLLALLPALTAVVGVTLLLMVATNPAHRLSLRLDAANAQLAALIDLSAAIDHYRDSIASSAHAKGEEPTTKAAAAVRKALAEVKSRAEVERASLDEDERDWMLREGALAPRLERAFRQQHEDVLNWLQARPAANDHAFKGGRALRQLLDETMLQPVQLAIADERAELDAVEHQLLDLQRSLRRWAYAIGLGGLLLTALASALLLRSVHQPIQRLTDATRRLAGGDFTVRVQEPGRDELAQLARDFSAMAAQLEQQHEALADRAARERAYAFQKEFLSLVTHELRSPLNSVQGFVELVLEREASLDPRSKKHLALVLDAARRMKNNIDDILDLSRIEAGQLEVDSASFEVAPLLGDLVEDARALVHGRDIDVKLETASGVEKVTSDEKRVRQILTNLLSNAAKFTQHGSITLKVWRDPEQRACFSVSDTGIGIPADKQAAIFEAFRQLDSDPRGTGLGLTIVSRLVNLLHGEIELTSAVGQGSTFSVTLPDQGES